MNFNNDVILESGVKLSVGNSAPTSLMDVLFPNIAGSYSIFTVGDQYSGDTYFSVVKYGSNKGKITALVEDNPFQINLYGSYGQFQVINRDNAIDYFQNAVHNSWEFASGSKAGASYEAGILNSYSVNLGTGGSNDWIVSANRILVGSDGTDSGLIYGLLVQKNGFNNNNATFYSGIFMGGSVGIDTLTPDAKLHIVVDNETGLYIQPTAITSFPQDVVSITLYGSNANHSLKITETGSSAGHKIESDYGYWGLGTTSDLSGTRLRVRGNSSSSSQFTFDVFNSNDDRIFMVRNSRNVGINTVADTDSSLHILGLTNDNTTYALKIQNSTPSDIFQVRNDSWIGAGSIANNSMSIGFSSNALVGNNNTFIGIATGRDNIDGYSNTFVGFSAGVNITHGFNNAFFGGGAGLGNTTGFQNTAIGISALSGGNNINCTIVGFSSAVNFNSFGDVNETLGANTLEQLTSGNGNVAVGYQALRSIVTGQNNVAVGQASGRFLDTNSSNNTLVGYYAGYGNGAYTGQQNVVIGSQANFTSKGSYNTILGTLAALNNDGSSNVFLGHSAGRNQSTTSNTLIIDNQDRGNASNEQLKSLIYGAFDSDPNNQTLRFNSKVSIGTASTAKFTVNSGVDNTVNSNAGLSVYGSGAGNIWMGYDQTSGNGHANIGSVVDGVAHTPLHLNPFADTYVDNMLYIGSGSGYTPVAQGSIGVQGIIQLAAHATLPAFTNIGNILQIRGGGFSPEGGSIAFGSNGGSGFNFTLRTPDETILMSVSDYGTVAIGTTPISSIKLLIDGATDIAGSYGINIRNNSANRNLFYVENNGKVYMDGSLGIGIAPAQKLHVSGADADAIIWQGNNTSASDGFGKFVLASCAAGFGISGWAQSTLFENQNSGNMVISSYLKDIVFQTGGRSVLATMKANGILNISMTQSFADNTAATGGGLVVGDVYKTATGQLMIVY